MHCLAAADDGARLSIAVGQMFALTLPETPTTGYRWAITEPSALMRVIEDEFAPPDSAHPGAGGTHRWLFRADHPGTGLVHVELVSRRASRPARSFDLTIDVVQQ